MKKGDEATNSFGYVCLACRGEAHHYDDELIGGCTSYNFKGRCILSFGNNVGHGIVHAIL